MIYKDDKANARTGNPDDYPTWSSNIADGKWHKVAWAVYIDQGGQSIAEFYVDNKFRGARALKRNGVEGKLSAAL